MSNALGALFGDIATAIREKTGDSRSMKPAEFPAKIGDISTSNVIENVEIDVDFSNGDVTESLPEGYSAKSVTIFKPETLIPENIAKDVDIAGVIGTHEGGSGEDDPTANPQWDMLPNTEITGFSLDEDSGCYSIYMESSPVVPDEGETYTILWDNKEYQCVCFLESNAHVLGNRAIVHGEDGEDTGEPFVIATGQEGNGVWIVSTDDKSSHTIRIIANKKYYRTFCFSPGYTYEPGNTSYYYKTFHHNMGVVPDIAMISFETLETASDGPVSLSIGYAACEAVSSRFAAATNREYVLTLTFLNGSSANLKFMGDNGVETSAMTILGGIRNATTSTIDVVMIPIHADAVYRVHLYGGLKLD